MEQIKTTLRCPQCGYLTEEAGAMRCPRCYKSLFNPAGCGGACHKCGRTGKDCETKESCFDKDHKTD